MKDLKRTKQLSFDEFLDDSMDKGNEDTEIEVEHLNGGSVSEIELFPVLLVRDFEKFIDYLENNSIQLTKKMGYISRKFLPAINNILSVKNRKAAKNTEQQYYPYIYFFHSLAISGRLFEKIGANAGKVLLRKTERYQIYKDLNDLEKYFFLLETFWVDVNWEKLNNERGSTPALTIQMIFDVFSQASEGYTITAKNLALQEKLAFNHINQWNYFILYMDWFGFWKSEIDQERIDQFYRKNHYFSKSIKLTPFGSKIIPLLLMERNFEIWNISERKQMGEVNPIPGSELDDMMFGDISQEAVDVLDLKKQEDQSSQPFFKPFADLFPNDRMKRTLPRTKKKFVDGSYIFKVSLTNGIWRKLVFTGKHTMEDLHRKILDAYGFDDDHLYSFFMDGDKWSKESIVSPYDDFGPLKAGRVQIRDLGLTTGQSFLYLYDYGDEWMFSVELEHLQEGESAQQRPYLKESRGNAPIQYGVDDF